MQQNNVFTDTDPFALFLPATVTAVTGSNSQITLIKTSDCAHFVASARNIRASEHMIVFLLPNEWNTNYHYYKVKKTWWFIPVAFTTRRAAGLSGTRYTELSLTSQISPKIYLSTTESPRAVCFTPSHSHYAPTSACNHACNNITATDSIMSNNNRLKAGGKQQWADILLFSATRNWW